MKKNTTTIFIIGMLVSFTVNFFIAGILRNYEQQTVNYNFALFISIWFIILIVIGAIFAELFSKFAKRLLRPFVYGYLIAFILVIYITLDSLVISVIGTRPLQIGPRPGIDDIHEMIKSSKVLNGTPLLEKQLWQ